MESSIEIVAPPPGRLPGSEPPPAPAPRPLGAFATLDARPPTRAATETVPPPEEPGDASPFLASLATGDDIATSARRAGAGLLLSVPFALAAGLRTGASPSDALVAALGLPVGLAMVALVGVSASTLGVSLISAPLEPSVAASVASRGLFRAGLVLAGLAPLTALWVASGDAIEGLLAASLAVFLAGVAGIGAIARGIVARTADTDGTPRLGALVVSALFVCFALVVGLRVWLPVADVLSPELFGGFE